MTQRKHKQGDHNRAPVNASGWMSNWISLALHHRRCGCDGCPHRHFVMLERWTFSLSKPLYGRWCKTNAKKQQIRAFFSLWAHLGQRPAKHERLLIIVKYSVEEKHKTRRCKNPGRHLSSQSDNDVQYFTHLTKAMIIILITMFLLHSNGSYK